MGFEFDTLVFEPGSLVERHPFIVVIELDSVVVGLEDNKLSDQPGRSRIGVGIEGDTEILVNLKTFDLPAIGKMLW